MTRCPARAGAAAKGAPAPKRKSPQLKVRARRLKENYAFRRERKGIVCFRSDISN